jgi:hypothetical protein
MRFFFKSFAVASIAAVALVFVWIGGPARAQMQIGIPAVPMGYCQTPAASLVSAVGFSSCVAASFTATCAGNVLTASAVTGDISPGWPLSGTGISAGTFVQSQGTGTGGAGTYIVSQTCTSSGASLTAVGPPNGANFVLMQSEAQNIRWRDDGGSPTTTVGMLLNSTALVPTLYNGQLGKIQFIDAVAGGILDASFYKTSSP